MDHTKRLRVVGNRRLILYIKQKGICPLCDKALESTIMDADHITPISLGGTNELSNLQLLHKECHANKTDREQRIRNAMTLELKTAHSKYFNDECSIFYLRTPIPTEIGVKQYITTHSAWWRHRIMLQKAARVLRFTMGLEQPP